MARAKGRHWVALWLVAFLVTTWLVYARQTAAIRAARELADLRARRANLDGHRADLERRIRAAESRAVLVPRAQARLGLTAPPWQQSLRRRYAYFAGPYSALEVQPLRSVRGVHLEPVPNRFYPDPSVARATIGRLGDDGQGASGLERTLDTLLAGRAGAAVVLKDRAGREYESPARGIAPPVPGLDVGLTLGAGRQGIAQRAVGDP